MAGAGYRTFASGEVLTANNVQTYLMDQAVQVYAGTAARSSAVPTPSTGMVAYSTATGLQVFDGSAWTDVGGVGYGEATGGASTATISVGGENFRLLTFTSDDNLVVSTAGLFDVLLIGGGGAGGSSSAYPGGGGGGGQVLGNSPIQTVYLPAATYAVDVAAGGTAGDDTIQFVKIGKITSLAGVVTAIGGGGGGQYQGGAFSHGATSAANGGAGGQAGTAGESILTGLGFAGGAGQGASGQGGGGGGGMGGVGQAGTAGVGGNGGSGVDISAWLGQSANTTRVAGGGGGSHASSPGTGTDGGANGTVNTNAATPTANRGGGGGGVTNSSTSVGGSGVCYIRFKV
jgi:hypothetical protein